MFGRLAGPATAGFFCSSLTSGKVRISTQAFDLLRQRTEEDASFVAQHNADIRLLAAAGKSDNHLTYLQKHGVSSAWAPMLVETSLQETVTQHLRSSDKHKKEVFPIAIQTIQTVEDG